MVKTLECFDLPQTSKERLTKLDKAIQTLKSEFVGLDEIIDSIRSSISPWYVTPEIINRPVVVSLWGMTGTGKTSVVRRLLDLLGLSGNTMFFDCGQEASDSGIDLSKKIAKLLGQEAEYSDELESSVSASNVFVFDEFQYARTIDSDGTELLKSSLRPVWNILDNGILNLNQSSWDVMNFTSFLEDLDSFTAAGGQDIEVIEGVINHAGDVKRIIDAIGLFWYGRGVPGITSESESNDCVTGNITSVDRSNSDNPYRPLRVLEYSILKLLMRSLNSYKSGYGREVLKDIFEAKTLGEVVDILKEASDIVTAPVEIDCSKSIVFVLGNLDEAFHVESDTNPDYDADVFYEITSNVTVLDIKTALQKRFRAEQIARLGNSMIKYPTLKKEHFREIIEREVNRIFKEFENTTNIKVNAGDGIIDLLYSEGVYPVQGVRPVFTTIGTLLTPILSDVLLGYPGEGEVDILVDSSEIDWRKHCFKVPQVDLMIEFSHLSRIKTLPLVLGALRDPGESRLIPITAIHEASHAVMSYYRTGVAPKTIVAVSANRGGFCDVYTDTDHEIDSRYDVDSDVMISMAGYWGECIFVKDKEYRLLGSSSDIEAAWHSLSNAAYYCGYFDNRSYSNFNTESGSPIPAGLDDTALLKDIETKFNDLQKKVYEILSTYKPLIKELAELLIVEGSITDNDFLRVIEEVGIPFEENSHGSRDYYLRCLREE